MADELSNLMENLDSTGNPLASTKALSNTDRSHQYKSKCIDDQRQRRNKLLALQKKNRKEIVDQLRKLHDDDWETFNSKVDLLAEEGMEVDRQHQKRLYADQLMLSEWLIEVPEDFCAQWLTLLSPIGRRCLVVADKGSTMMYSKSGHRINNFPSLLPAGCRSKRRHSTAADGRTLLDCVFSEDRKTFYVLDVLCWNGHPVIDSEAEFRFFWLRSKLEESPDTSQFSNLNPFIFRPVPLFKCSNYGLAEGLSVSYDHVKVDGLLFYHKQAHYLCGSTPLVLWLKPYMVPEVLGINVHEDYMQGKPAAYGGHEAHLTLIQSDQTLSKTHQELYASPHGKKSKSERILSAQSCETREDDSCTDRATMDI